MELRYARMRFRGKTMQHKCLGHCAEIPVTVEEDEAMGEIMNDLSRNGHSCSFCGTSQDDIAFIIAAPTVCICDECIEICNQVLFEQFRTVQGDYEELKKTRIVQYSEICG